MTRVLYLLITCMCLACGSRAAAQTISRAQAHQDLDALWSHLNDRFSYFQLRDFDKQAAIDDARQACVDPMPVDEFAQRIHRLLCRFGDGHGGVEGVERFLARGYTPCLFGEVESRIVAFWPDRSGFVDPQRLYVAAINGVAIDRWISAAAELAPQSSPQWNYRNAVRNLRLARQLGRTLDRHIGDALFIELTNADGSDSVTRRVTVATRKPLYGAWPRTESVRRDDDIGYYRLAKMRRDDRIDVLRTMERFRKTKGLIIDVRGNTGGTRHALRAIYPYFLAPSDPPAVLNLAAHRLHPDFDRDHLATRFLYREDNSHHSDRERDAIRQHMATFTPQWQLPAGMFSDWHFLVAEPHDAPPTFYYDRPVVVLMNGDNFSATDVFLGAMRQLDQVTLLGTPSGGGSGCTTVVTLPNSRIDVRLSSMASFQPDGRLYDGNGIPPDVVVHATPGYYVGGPDMQLEAAIRLIEDRVADNDEEPGDDQDQANESDRQ